MAHNEEEMIERRLNDAGYRMFGSEKRIEQLILDILKSGNNRYLKAIPFLIYKYRPDIHVLHQLAERENLARPFERLLQITAQLFKESAIALPERISDIAKGSAKPQDIAEFRDEFRLQLRNEKPPTLLIDKQKMHAERELQMHLSELFTKKERHIIRRVLDEKPLSRTEYEYYSRKTKKKLTSILNLQEFARALSSKSPVYDEDLFALKKRLEELLEKRSGEKVSVTWFSASGKTASIRYKKRDGTEATVSMGKELDAHLREELTRYGSHDFT